MELSRIRLWNLAEALAFAAFVGWYIWQLQTLWFYAWLLFPVWLIVSFVAHGDTPKSIGWRADNLFAATKTSTLILGVFAAGLALLGILLDTMHRQAPQLLVPKHFLGYTAFCLLQQVGLNSYVANRLLASTEKPFAASLLAGAIFAALHWPNPVLIPLTFIGGTAMSWLFARERNILPLAVWQGVLGTLVWWAFPVVWHHGMRVGPGFYSFHPR